MISASLSLRNRVRMLSGHRTILALLDEEVPWCDIVVFFLGREGMEALDDVLPLSSPILMQNRPNSMNGVDIGLMKY